MPYKDRAKADAASKQWKERNPDKVRERSRRYQKSRPEANAVYRKNWEAKNPDYRRERYEANKPKMRKQAREKGWRLKGLPFPTRLEPTLCECCGDPPPTDRVLNLDHDHQTGKFRGWLCWECNTGIGKLGDNADGVRRALDYLLRNT